MRQKLAICCAYLHAPRAILFDEPMTGLDPHGIRTLKNSIAERARQEAAVIVSSHLLAMVEDICTHVLILESGEQRFCGPIGQLRNEYAPTEQSSTLEDIYFRATNSNQRAGALA
jgi:ABC-2 type transport system ATP-binding protein